jgi:hypothetical protein
MSDSNLVHIPNLLYLAPFVLKMSLRSLDTRPLHSPLVDGQVGLAQRYRGTRPDAPLHANALDQCSKLPCAGGFCRHAQLAATTIDSRRPSGQSHVCSPLLLELNFEDGAVAAPFPLPAIPTPTPSPSITTPLPLVVRTVEDSL